MAKKATPALSGLLTDARVERVAKAQPLKPRFEGLCAELGVAAPAPGVVEYATATSDVELVLGPWTLHGFGARLPAAKTCDELFSTFGETPFPAVCIGSDRRGIDFWLAVESGRVITLHEDASFYEEAARCPSGSVEMFMAAFIERGAAFDIAQLARLQIALHEAPWTTELERQQVWARAAATVLGVTLASIAKRAGHLPYELLHLEPSIVEELAAEPAPNKGKRSTAEKLPPQLVEALAGGARTLDLAGVLDVTLPARVAELTDLEEIDLSENPRLDFEDAFAQLATLPRLRFVKFADCRMGTLPAALARLQALEELDLSSSVFKGPHNFFVLDQVLPIIRQLPRLRVLDASVCRGPTDMTAFVAALPTLERLTLDGGSGYSEFTVPGPSALEELSLRGLSVDQLIDAPPASFPQLRKLALVQASIRPDGGYHDDWDENERRRKLRFDRLIHWLAELPALGVLDLRLCAINVEELPESVAKLRVEELWIAIRQVPAWIGRMRTMRALHVRNVREPLPAEIGDLAELESLDAGGLGVGEACKLGALPAEIGKLARLRTLTAREVERWPETLRHCKALEVLECGNNAPPFLHELTSLRRSDGPVAALVQLPYLEHIDISGTKQVPETLSGHRTLRSVRWWAYNLEDDFDVALERVLSLPALESLELACVPRTTLPASLLTPSLRRLRLNVTDRDTPGIDLPKLFALLARSRIDTVALNTDRPVVLPDELGDVASMHHLELYGTGFSKLPGSITRLARLRRIILRQTKIGAPERKRIRAALPGCRVTVHD